MGCDMRLCSLVLYVMLYALTSLAMIPTKQSTIVSTSRKLPGLKMIDRLMRVRNSKVLYSKASKEGSESQSQEITDLNLEQMFEVFEAADNAIPATNGGTKTTVSAH